MTEKDIQKILYNHYTEKGHNYIVPNIFLSGEESDFISLSKSKYLYEVEIKLTLSDFKADFKKYKHHLFTSVLPIPANSIPNRFFYICPENIIPLILIPKYAGLLYICGDYHYVKQIKSAPLLHKNKIDRRQLLKMIYTLSDKLWEYIFNDKLPTKNIQE